MTSRNVELDKEAIEEIEATGKLSDDTRNQILARIKANVESLGGKIFSPSTNNPGQDPEVSYSRSGAAKGK